MKDFKNSKKFWQFYKSSVKLRSDQSNDDYPEIIHHGDIEASTAADQAEMFNNFFTNIESSSFSTENESAKCIFEKFKDLKKTNKIITPGFSFNTFNITDIDECLNDLSSTSSSGHTGIHTKILKAVPEIFCPIIQLLFNSCLELRMIPEDWKIGR